MERRGEAEGMQTLWTVTKKQLQGQIQTQSPKD